MATRARISRNLIVLAVVALLAATLVVLFLPEPQSVDLGEVRRGDLAVTIVEEGRTKVRETYTVSTPVSGRLLRVQVRPGDAVEQGATVVARMMPTQPEVLDSRTREQAEAAVEAAKAGVRLAQANLDAMRAEAQLARAELDRTLSLFNKGIVSQAALDRVSSEELASRARLETARAAIAMREAELANAQARLVARDDIGLAAAIADSAAQAIPLFSPIDGRILRVFQESETVVPAGSPIIEIGDVETGLEVVVDLISSDAVKVSVGDPVILRDWGGGTDLDGRVVRIDPFGVTKTSALGIEEQRVRVEIDLESPPEARPGLGHGYRLEVAIVIWHGSDLSLVPTSALYRNNGDWFVFKATDGTAVSTRVEIGQSDGVYTVVESGLDTGDRVILYPSAAVFDGVAIVDRAAAQ